MSVATLPLTVPFTVVVDTREQRYWNFRGLTADAAQRRRPLVVPLVSGTLASGDYSIEGFEDVVALERKSAADLYSTVSQGRRRFERELSRLNVLPGFAAIVVEAEMGELLQEPPRYSQLPPKNLWRSVLAWQQKYRGVHWWFCRDRRLAEVTTFRMLERFWKMRQKNTNTNTDKDNGNANGTPQQASRGGPQH